MDHLIKKKSGILIIHVEKRHQTPIQINLGPHLKNFFLILEKKYGNTICIERISHTG